MMVYLCAWGEPLVGTLTHQFIHTSAWPCLLPECNCDARTQLGEAGESGSKHKTARLTTMGGHHCVGIGSQMTTEHMLATLSFVDTPIARECQHQRLNLKLIATIAGANFPARDMEE
jgi:hypothetical protein